MAEGIIRLPKLFSVIVVSGYSFNQYTISKKISSKKDELSVKVAKLKEKGIDTDKLEKILKQAEEGVKK